LQIKAQEYWPLDKSMDNAVLFKCFGSDLIVVGDWEDVLEVNTGAFLDSFLMANGIYQVTLKN
jgi:hypothetical protein